MPHDTRTQPRRPNDRGTTLIELMIALVVLSLGLLALAQMFPAGSRNQLQSRMRTTASYYVQQKIEELTTVNWNDPALSTGAHPGGGASDTLGGGAWLRSYAVDVLPSPLNNLKRVSVTVSWNYMGTRSLTDTTYVRL